MTSPLQDLITNRPIVGFESPAELPLTVYAETPTPLAAFDPTKPTIDQTRQNAIDSIRNNFQNLPSSLPGGAITQVQFNDGGVFGGDAGLTYNKTTDCLALGAGSARPWVGQVALDIGPAGHLRSDAVTCEFGNNLYYDSAGWKFRNAGAGAILYLNTATPSAPYMALSFAPAGAAGGAATPAIAMSVDTTATWITGNLNFNGVGRRIGVRDTTGPLGDRTLFQCADVNHNTILGVLPNGTAALAAIQVYNNSNPNANGTCYGDIRINASTVQITSAAAGPAAGGAAPAVLPITFNVNSVLHTINVDGSWSLGGFVRCGDLYPARAADSGCVFFGVNGASYLYNDGANFTLQNHPLITSSNVGVATGGVAPVSLLDVKTAANAHVIVLSSNGLPCIGSVNDGFSGWNDLTVYCATAFQPNVDNAVGLGNATRRWKQLFAATSTISTSDARLKKNVQDSPLGLAFVESLHPVSYQWINGGNSMTRVPDYEEPVPETTTIDGEVIPATTRTIYKDEITSTEGKRTHFGLIAQEVRQAVAASGVADFGGYIQTDMSNPESELGLRYEEFVAPLIKAVQELSARVKALEGAGNV
jgi:hypothetical protein